MKLKQLINSPDFSGGSLAYHALQPQMETDWLNGAALPRIANFVIGEPLSATGTNDSFPDSVELRRSFPHLSFAHIGSKFARSLRDAGYNVVPLGCEALVELPFSLAGQRKSDLRRALNLSRKAGVQVREVSERKFPAYAGEIGHANKAWLESRPLFRQEFRFLARPFVNRFQAGERRFVALLGRQIMGLAVYDPIIVGGSPNGYFEAIIRGYGSSPPGVRDLLTLTALDQFATEGAEWVSLGLCPFHRQPDNCGLVNSHVSDLALNIFYRFGGRIFNCSGLAFHKSRYRPRFKTVYFATQSRLPLVELYRICRLSNINPLCHALRLRDNIRSIFVQLTVPDRKHARPEHGAFHRQH